MVKELLLVINWTKYVVCILTLRAAAFICFINGQKKLTSLLKINYVLLVGCVIWSLKATDVFLTHSRFKFSNFGIML